VRGRSLARVETERLVATRVAPEDADELTLLLGDPQVKKTLFPNRDVPTGIEIDAHIIEKCKHWDAYGFGVWTLRDRGTGELVGRGGLQHTPITGEDEVELLWVITPARWNQGLATEIAYRAVEIAFDVLDLDQVIAFTLVDNRASRRVMEKAGLTYDREIEHVGLPHVLYRRVRC
jgi:ribosomal-protein-alanine N-acetyltransferase